MKNPLFILLFFSHLLINAQIADFYKSDLSRIGYKRNWFTFENLPKNYELANTYKDSSNVRIKGGSFDVSMDIFTKHLYFATDLSLVLDGLVALTVQGVSNKDRWYDNQNYFVVRSQYLPTRMAFGNNIGKYFALYGGGQWQYLETGIRYKNNQPQANPLIHGNQFGYGIHGVFAYKGILIRQSFMQDWISTARTFQGRAITNETMIMYGYKNAGFYLSFNHMWRQKDGGYYPEDYEAYFKSKVNTDKYKFHHREQMIQFTMSIGVYATGLISGVTNTVTRATVISETGLRNERNAEKRRKVEYKD